MKKILVASTNERIIDATNRAKKRYTAHFDFDVCKETESALKSIRFELPEIKVIDCTSETLDWMGIFEAISSDQWLHNGGIVAVVKDADQQKEIEDLKNKSILIVQTVTQFSIHCTRILMILLKNQHFLFSRGILDHFGESEKGSFISNNSPLDIQVYAGFLVNYLYSANLIDDATRYNLHTTLMELFFNALEHGNCGISYDEKTDWLDTGRGMLELIGQKNKNPEIAKRHIYIDYSIEKTFAKFSIRDEGDGFDWRSRVNQTIEAGTHGMGIKLTENLVHNLTYNEKGNAVSFTVPTSQNTVNSVPSIMSQYTVSDYKDRDVVCKQNEPSNNVFFIVSGRYAVYVNRKLVSVLTPNDIFIGEMSFLLNDKRSAAILAIGEGKLIKIPKSTFLNLIRTNPHYALFLAKLLAQRLYNQTQKSIAATS